MVANEVLLSVQRQIGFCRHGEEIFQFTTTRDLNLRTHPNHEFTWRAASRRPSYRP